eukprot:2580972-Rhodomonas_salina.1
MGSEWREAPARCFGPPVGSQPASTPRAQPPSFSSLSPPPFFFPKGWGGRQARIEAQRRSWKIRQNL